MSMVNSWCGFHGDLEEVWLGSCYPSNFYDHMDSEIRDVFYEITEWTEKDLSRIDLALKAHGVTVRRPNLNQIENFLDEDDRLLKPPIAPRDDTLVLGDRLWQLRNYYRHDPWQEFLDQYASSGAKIQIEKDGPWACLSPPCLVRMGRDIYVDWIYHKHVWGMITEPLVELAKDFRIHVSMLDGHSDCVFCPIESGLILSTEYKQAYNKTYPDWEVYWLLNNPVRKRIVNTTGGFFQWHAPVANAGNKSFADHIQKYALDWIGQSEETIFDVNLLKVNDNTIFSVGEDHELFEFLHKRGYNIEVFDFRCKTFWDAGMHCLTNDIRRTGECPDFFPDRGGPSLDWLHDEN
jgi:hypothetical protein